MNLEIFAKEAGVKVVANSTNGGKFGYQTKDHPNCTVVGFRTKQSAYIGWLKSTFGQHTAKALMKLLDHS